MKRIRGRIVGAVALGLLLIAAAKADTLHLKDGRVLQGRYLGGTQTFLRFEINGEVKSFAVTDVASVTFTRAGAPANPAPDADASAPAAPDSSPADAASPAPAAVPAGSGNAEPPIVSQDTVPPAADNDASSMAAPAAAAPPGATAPVSGPPAQPAPAPGASAEVTLPAGQELLVRMIDGVDSSKNQVGDVFHASLETDLYASGVFIARKGSDVYGKLAEAHDAGKMSGKAVLQLQLTRIVIDGREYPLSSSDYTVRGQSQNTETAKKVGGGAIIGAIIGGIVGGERGAAIGAGAGAGTGAVAQGLSKGEKVRVPSETLLEFRLEQPAEVVPTQR